MMGRKVPGIGARPAFIFGCGEAPGIQESEEGRPWVGKAGRELRRYIERSARLTFDGEWYLTNIVKYRPETKRTTGNNPPTAADIKRDEPELARELLDAEPSWIVAIGRYSLQWFLGRKASVTRCRGFAFPLPPETLDKIGRLTDTDRDEVERTLGEVRVVSVTHPAAGLHDTDAQGDIDADFKRLGQMVRGEISLEPPVDRWPDPDYRHARYLPVLSPRDVGFDTEGYVTNPWSAQVSWQPGMGRLLLADDPIAIQSLRRFLLEGHTIELHNAPHDIPVICRLMGWDVYEFADRVKFEDTMQMAFTHRLTPKALKDLGARFEGIQNVRKYMEVVGPYDQLRAEEYLLRVLNEHQCVVCGGHGQVLDTERFHKSSGRRLEPKMEKCEACGGDGTDWEPPAEKLVWDNDKQRVRLSRGWRMGRRVRNMLNRLADEEAERDAAEVRDDGTVLTDFDESALDSSEAADSHTVAGLRRKWLNVDYEFRIQVEDKLGPMPEASLDDVPFTEALEYACRDSDMTRRIRPKLEEMLRADDLWSVYEADRNTIPYITQMMQVGMKIDVPYLNELSDFLSVEMDQKLYKLERLAGHYVNPNSMNQVGDLLFDQLGLKPVKLTATGIESTDNKVLKDLQLQVASEMERSVGARRAYEALTLILDYRERSKMKSTYTVALPRRVDANSRLHTIFKGASVASRRLASAEPNLMNIPSRTVLGKKVKYAFTCEDDNVLVCADYKQLEFRILAHAAGEKSLIYAINNGIDLHAMTASMMFDAPLDKVTDSQRRAAKTINFAVLYGASAPTIKAQVKMLAGMDVPEEECQGWINDYTGKKFPAIGEYIDDCIAHARRYGYSVDMWGHRRYLPGVHSAINSVKAEAERVAVNHTIQSAASGIVRLAMKASWDMLPKFRRRGFCEPVLQLHDDLTDEVRRSMAEEFAKEQVRVMSNIVRWEIPIDADVAIVRRWGSKEPLDAVVAEVA